MPVSSKDTQATQKASGPKAKKTKKKRGLLFRVLSFVIMTALVLGGVALVVYRDELNIDALRRAIAYRKLERSATGQSTEFQYEEDTSNRFDTYRGGLLVASTTNIQLFAQSGSVLFSENIFMSDPALCTTDNYAVVYDIGGSQLVAFTDMQASLQLNLEDNLSIFSAQLNDSGWLAVTTQESGYKAVVHVYNNEQNLVYQWNSSSHFVTDAVVYNDCNTMAAVSIGQNGTEYQSTLSLFRLDSEDLYASLDLGNRLVLSVTAMGNRVCVLTESEILFVDAEGQLIGSFPYSSQYLRACSLEGDDFAALQLGKYRAGSIGELVTVDSSGTVIATLSLSEDIISLSAAGRYVAVLYADRLEIYDKELQLYAQLNGTENARNALVREDGSVMFIGAGTAWLYIPG